MLKSEPVLSVDRLSKKYSRDLRSSLWYGLHDIAHEMAWWDKNSSTPKLRKGEFWALNEINFDLHAGESLAIIGTNGAGKSTLLKILYGLIKPDYGEVRVNGRVGALIELGTGFNPVLSGRENIYINAAILGFSRRQVDEIIEQIEDFAGIQGSMDTPVKYYSTGMTARLSYAISAHLNPDIFLVDEALAVGDLAYQRKCFQHMRKYLDGGGTLIFVSHSPYHIQSICQRGILLEQGQLKYIGTAIETLNRYFETQHDKERIRQLTQQEGKECRVVLNKEYPVAIESIFVEPLQGGTIRTDEAVRLVVNYHTLEHRDVLWGFSIMTGDQWVCVTGDQTTLPQAIPAGRGQLSCIVPKLPLVAGSYWLRAAIIDPSTLQPMALLGWKDAPYPLIVRDHASHLNNSRTATNQLVTLDVDWTKCYE